jgi:threonylcarbamoyladenosine tRNA methylthiotransferase MtaB
MSTTKTIAYHTLGCKLNFSETSTLTRLTKEEGYEQKKFNEAADVYVINTCSVTENADKECKQLIRRVKRQNPQSKVVITGCYAQLKANEIAQIQGVDMVLGAQEKFNIVQHLKTNDQDPLQKVYSCEVENIEGFNASYSQNDRTRTFLKIQDGCDYTCTFCTIPLARGHSRSDTIEGVINNIKELAKADVQEIVLTGVNIGDFGKGFNGNRKNEETFFDLVKAMDALDAVSRYRISSIEPNLLTEDIIKFVSTSNHFMPHFHIPLQSGNNELLAKMSRRYKRELYEERVALIKKHIPHCCIGVDVIVGFPGETDEHFEDTFQFLHQLDISYLHVFTYSERENTKAVLMENVVPISVRNERNKRLRILSEKKMNYFTEQHKHTTRKVLFESETKENTVEGYTDNYIKIAVPFDAELVNKIIDHII